MRRSHRPTSLVLVAALAACFAAPVAADFNRGFDAWDRGQYKRAIREFRSAAERGDARAQNYLGQMYEDGQGLPEDIAAAVSWYQKAANAGEPAAQLNLGRLYEAVKESLKATLLRSDGTELLPSRDLASPNFSWD